MNLISLSERQGKILNILRGTAGLSSSVIKKGLGDVSLATIKREIAVLARAHYIVSTGKGRGGGYVLTKVGELFAPVDARLYCAVETDKRNAFETYDMELFLAIPRSVFTDDEIARLNFKTEQFRDRSKELSEALARKELERFVIELSWKSSRIEGNTYTLLDTERLIRDGIEAPGHGHEEAIMILNHKRAFEFAYKNREEFVGQPSRAAIEELHRLLVDGLNVNFGFRRQAVGIVGTRYRPLDNQFQIGEAMDTLRNIIGVAADPYTAALLAIVGISYIQPFEDGNKRTARLLANAILFARERAPLSYRSVDEAAYREATLVFYETHSLVPFRNIFTAQYFFAAEQYGVK